tara:strand:+ start:949 stop:1269 length:321 start_codon:yes stop_codon:yes gene_type:complete
MAITATVDLGNGISKASCYLIIPTAYVKKFNDVDGEGNAGFKLIYDVIIYKDASDRATNKQAKQIKCRTVDHHKLTYDPTSGEQNAFKLSYADLKTNSSLSSVADA